MSRPRLFLSAASEELSSARKAVAATARTLGFDPVSQDDFPTGYGELRKWLLEQIDSCEGLIQLIGHGYGAEPAEVDPTYGRASYTQLEFLYASRQKKKTWVIVAGEGCSRDKSIDQLDLPREAAHTDPAGYQAERRKLQQDYLARLKRENHLRHTANNDTELQNIVLRLRDELGELRKKWEEWLKKDANFKTLTTAQLDKITEAARLTTEKIQAHLLKTAGETYSRELAEADAAKDWKKRQQLREAADNAHATRLTRIEELAASFAEIEGRGIATSVFNEMTRIVAEQGVDEAIAYVATQRSSILKAVDDITKTAHERIRATMQPLLQLAGLHESRGQAAEARGLYTDILGKDPDWPEGLHAAFRFHIDQGDIARVRTTLADARCDYEEAQRMAQHLTAGDPTNTAWQRNLSVSCERLGDVAAERGQLEEAAQFYGEAQAIVKKLIAGDPTNTAWQRNLSISYDRLGNVAAVRGQLEEAAQFYGEGQAIVKKLVASDLTNAEWQRNLSISYGRLGDVAIIRSQLEEAARFYGENLAISKKVAADDPTNTGCQHDLLMSYGRLGQVAEKRGQLEEAAQFYGEAQAIAKMLVAVDPSNTVWQRDLLISYEELGSVSVARGQLEEAAQFYGEGQAIAKMLVAGDPTKTSWQRDLSVSYRSFGDVAAERGQLEEAAQFYGEAQAIAKMLVAVDPSNTVWQRHLSLSYWRLADMAERQNKAGEAKAYWKQAFDVLSGIEKRGLHLSPQDRQYLETLRRKAGTAP